MRKNLNLIALGGLVSTTVVSGLVLSSPMTRAANSSSTTTAKVTVSSVCSMTATVTSEHTANLIAGTYSGTNYPNGIGETSIETFCNDQNGYAIYAIGFTNNVLGNNKLSGVGLSANDDIITGTNTGPVNNNDISNWAMKVTAGAGTDAPSILNGFDSFSAVPSSYTKVASLGHVTTSSTIKTTYAAYISATQPAGTYTGQVKYTLVHPNTEGAPYDAMQNISVAKLAELMPNNGDTTTLKDSRDENIYTVAKIDGNYWMTKNLDLPGGTTLTPADSNVSSNYTLPASSTSGFSDNATAYVYNSNSTTCGNGSPCYSYYSYAAATAGTNPSSGEATFDICPKGWRLPTKAEYDSLKTAYTTGATLTTAPFSGVYAGYYSNSSFYDGGSYGHYWSSTASSASYAYSLLFVGSDAFFHGSDKRLGNSVRCVYDLLTMQSMTSAKLAELMPTDGSTTTLPDSRDGNVYNIARIGNTYWMTKNLDLAGGTTLTPADSNVSSNYTLPASSTSGFSDDSTAYVYNSNSTTCGDGSPCYSYYSYAAATAGTGASLTSGEATFDICPKGWRLPTKAEYNSLVATYTTGATLTAAPWKGVYAGYYFNSPFREGGSYGNYWSSTANNASDAYTLRFNSSDAYTLGGNKRNGNAVRCIAS